MPSLLCGVQALLWGQRVRIMVRMERGVWGDVGCVGRVESRWGQVCVWGRESQHTCPWSRQSRVRLSKSVINQCSLTDRGSGGTHSHTHIHTRRTRASSLSGIDSSWLVHRL